MRTWLSCARTRWTAIIWPAASRAVCSTRGTSRGVASHNAAASASSLRPAVPRLRCRQRRGFHDESVKSDHVRVVALSADRSRRFRADPGRLCGKGCDQGAFGDLRGRGDLGDRNPQGLLMLRMWERRGGAKRPRFPTRYPARVGLLALRRSSGALEHPPLAYPPSRRCPEPSSS